MYYAGFVDNGLLQFTKDYFKIIQTFMLLDIVHVIFKLTPGQLLSTLCLIGGRVYFVWMIIPSDPGFPIWNYILFTVWGLAEIIRFSYYVNKNSKLLFFLRYNAFIVLIPTGILGAEIPLLYQYFKAGRSLWQIILLIIYIPFFPYVYIHLLGVRKKNMNKAKHDANKKN